MAGPETRSWISWGRPCHTIHIKTIPERLRGLHGMNAPRPRQCPGDTCVTRSTTMRKLVGRFAIIHYYCLHWSSQSFLFLSPTALESETCHFGAQYKFVTLNHHCMHNSKKADPVPRINRAPASENNVKLNTIQEEPITCKSTEGYISIEVRSSYQTRLADEKV